MFLNFATGRCYFPLLSQLPPKFFLTFLTTAAIILYLTNCRHYFSLFSNCSCYFPFIWFSQYIHYCFYFLHCSYYFALFTQLHPLFSFAFPTIVTIFFSLSNGSYYLVFTFPTAVTIFFSLSNCSYY